MARAKGPVAVESLWEFWVWLDARVADFPVSARHSLGEPLCTTTIEAMRALVSAGYRPRGSAEQRDALRTANEALALLRLLVRGAHARRYLSSDQHAFATGRLVEVGRMIGGWLKAGAGTS